MLSATLLAQQEDRRSAKIRGIWSGEAVSLFNTAGAFDQNPGRKLRLFSPDRTVRVDIKEEEVALWVEGKRIKTNIGRRTNPELGWSPDSKYFFLTWTEGGLVGDWHVSIFLISHNGITEFKKLEQPATTDFRKRIRGRGTDKRLSPEMWAMTEECYPNAVGSQWLNGSNELLISVLVPSTSACRRMSEFNVYRIAVPSGKILQRYTAEEAHRVFSKDNLPIITRD